MGLSCYTETLSFLLASIAYVSFLWMNCVVPKSDIVQKFSYDHSPTAVVFHLSGKSVQPDVQCSTSPHPFKLTYVPSSTHMGIFTCHNAFGYTPAPYGSIVLHTESLGALYFQSIPRYHISYASDRPDDVVVSVVPDYMTCMTFLDAYSRITLHCHNSGNLTVSSFADVAVSTVLRVAQSRAMQLLVDVTSRLTILCLDMSDKPPLVIRMMCLIFERSFMLKHDFRWKHILITNFNPLHVRPYVVICTALSSSGKVMENWIGTCHQNKTHSKFLHHKNLSQNISGTVLAYNTKHSSEHSKISNQFHFYGGGKSLIFSSDELHPYALADLQEQQYQFLRCVKKDTKQSTVLGDGDILCSVPLNILTPKLTLKIAKELALLHGMYMHSKILLKNAQSLLQDHKCYNCDDLLAVFKPYKISSNAEHQKAWYQENTEKCAKYDKHCYSKSEYQKSHQKSMQKYYFSKKDVKFPPNPPSVELCQNIV